MGDKCISESMENSLCPGNLKNTPDSCEHESHMRHLSQTEVGTVEEEDRKLSSQSGEGDRWEDSR